MAAPAAAQQRPGAATVTGAVVDARSGEGIAGALVEAMPGEIRVAADAEGWFQLRMRAGGSLVKVSRLGYADRQQPMAAQAGTPPEPLVFAMEPLPVVLERLDVVLDRFAADGVGWSGSSDDFTMPNTWPKGVGAPAVRALAAAG
ncbi:MAG TPA: hypothetical protein VHG93_26560 [Longimicrobium sp.]|nr:hypothetical protein [Longimicrobium sp.]